jgi:acetoin utilization protein AcuB
MKNQQIKVSEVMHTDVKTLDRNSKLSVAEDIMKQERIRHLPVLDSGGKVCGIVSQRDLFRGILLRALGYGTYLENKMLESHTVKEAMVEPVQSIAPDAFLEEAAQTMIEYKIGCLVVIDNETLVGIITETDFVSQFVKE